MGIHSLMRLIEDVCPQVVREKRLSQFVGQTWVIDTSVWIQQIRYGHPDNDDHSYLERLIRRITTLMNAGIRLIFVFDGTAPVEKSETRLKRQEIRNTILNKIDVQNNKRKALEMELCEQMEIDDVSRLEEHLQRIKTEILVAATTPQEQPEQPEQPKTSESMDIDRENDQQLPEQQVSEQTPPISMSLSDPPPPPPPPPQQPEQPSSSSEQQQPLDSLIAAFETAVEHLQTLQRQHIVVTPEIRRQVRVLIHALNIPAVDAPGEAEEECARLVMMGVADAVVSEDTDTLVFGGNVWLRNVHNAVAKGEYVQEIRLDEVLNGLKLTHPQFVDMCILTGCDFCPRIPLFGIRTAFQWIHKFHTIEHCLAQMEANRQAATAGPLLKKRKVYSRNKGGKAAGKSSRSKNEECEAEEEEEEQFTKAVFHKAFREPPNYRFEAARRIFLRNYNDKLMAPDQFVFKQEITWNERQSDETILAAFDIDVQNPDHKHLADRLISLLDRHSNAFERMHGLYDLFNKKRQAAALPSEDNQQTLSQSVEVAQQCT